MVNDLRWGVYVVFEAGDDDARAAYTRRCFREYAITTDPSGRYGALVPDGAFHRPRARRQRRLGGAAARGDRQSDRLPRRRGRRGQKPLATGEVLDGEGGYTVWGRIMRAEDSLAAGALPIGLAHKVKLVRPVAAGDVVRWDDVAIEETEAVRIRRAMETAAGAKRNAAE